MSLGDLSLIDLYLISPGIVLFTVSILILFLKVFLKNKEPGVKIVSFLALSGVAATWLLSLSIFNSISGEKIYAFQGVLVFDAFTYWVSSAIFLAGSISIYLIHADKNIEQNRLTELLFLILNSMLGILIVLWSNTLLVLFVGIELVSLPLYTMILLSRKAGYTKESSIKYYILGSVASAFFLLGMVLIYGTSAAQYGSGVALNIEQLLVASSDLMKVDHLFLIGSTFMLLAALVKIGLFPVHNWVPDVYQGANTSLTYYMITAAKISAILVLIKLMSAGFLVEAEFFKLALQWIVVLSMVFGALFAFAQESIKRIFAYSGIAQSGYMLMSILGFGFDGKGSIDSLVFYFFPYVFFLGLVFAVVQSLEIKKGGDLNIMDLSGLSKAHPYQAVLLLIGIIGVSGMPPLVGFMTKAYILQTAVQTGFYWVAFWALIASAFSMVYYIKIIARLYFYEHKEETYLLWESPLKMKAFSFQNFLVLVPLLLVSLLALYYFPLNV